MLGVSEIGSDMRELEQAVENGDERAMMTMKMYNYRIRKYIGAYAAAMGGVDIIVFTAGVGENQASTREEACQGLEFMGVSLDNELNSGVRGKEVVLSKPDSKVKVCLIPTDEELMIASDTKNILEQ